jgi:hypothetical protein
MDTTAQNCGVTPENGGRDKRGRFQRGNQWRLPTGARLNPGGRPKKLPLTESLRELLLTKLPDTAEGRRIRKTYGLATDATWATAICNAQLRMALTSTAAAAEIADRTEGKPPVRLEFGPSQNIRFEVHYVTSPTGVERDETLPLPSMPQSPR